MVLVGASWVLFWALIQPFKMEIPLAAIITGIVFILVGLVLGERPTFNRP